jgi:hypothetical protein
MGQDLRGNLDHHKRIRESASLFKDLETELYGAPEKQPLPQRMLSAIGVGGRPDRLRTEQPDGPPAQGVAVGKQPKALSFDELADLHQRYSMRAAKDPELYKQAQPMLDQVRSMAFSEYVGGFQGDTTTVAGALDYGEYIGRGLARFGEMPDPTKTVQRAAAAERVEIARDSQQSQAQSRETRDAAYLADRQDAARSRADRDATYRESATARASGQGSQDPLKAQQQDVRQQQAIFDLLHTDPDRAFQMAADLYGVEFRSVTEVEVPGPNGQPVRAIQFEMWQDGKMVGTSNTFEESVRLGRTRAALEGKVDAEGNPVKTDASAGKPDPVAKAFRGLFTDAWTGSPTEEQLEFLNLGEAHAIELKRKGMSDQEAADVAKRRVVLLEDRARTLNGLGVKIDTREAWGAPDPAKLDAAAVEAAFGEWEQVAKSEGYRNADPRVKERERADFFKSRIAPGVPTEQLAEIKQRFDKASKSSRFQDASRAVGGAIMGLFPEPAAQTAPAAPVARDPKYGPEPPAMRDEDVDAFMDRVLGKK